MNKFIPPVMRALACVLALGAVGLAGCVDNTMTDTIHPDRPATGNKLQFGHMLQTAYRDSGEGLGKGGGRRVEFVIGLDKGLKTTADFMSIYGVVDRYGIIDRYGVVERYQYDDVFYGISVSVDEEVYDAFMRDLNADPAVLWYEPNFAYTDPATGATTTTATTQIINWGIQRTGGAISSTRAGDGIGSVSGAEVFLLDTGVLNPDVNVGMNIDVPLLAASGIAAAPGIPLDGHGTHIAGVIGAYDDTDGVVGMAPGILIHSLDVQDANGLIDDATLARAVEYVIDYKKVNPGKKLVVNISLGANVGTTTYSALDRAVKTAVASGIFVVVAAGNDAVDARLVSPAHVTEAFTVGAYTSSNAFASYSNFGSVVDMLAPGSSIGSLLVEPVTSMNLAVRSGTSMSTGFVAGAAALWMSKQAAPTVSAVETALKGAGIDLITGVPTGTTVRSVYAAGF